MVAPRAAKKNGDSIHRIENTRLQLSQRNLCDVLSQWHNQYLVSSFNVTVPQSSDRNHCPLRLIRERAGTSVWRMLCTFNSPDVTASGANNFQIARFLRSFLVESMLIKLRECGCTRKHPWFLTGTTSKMGQRLSSTDL